jgi:hypothetical protein
MDSNKPNEVPLPSPTPEPGVDIPDFNKQIAQAESNSKIELITFVESLTKWVLFGLSLTYLLSSFSTECFHSTNSQDSQSHFLNVPWGKQATSIHILDLSKEEKLVIISAISVNSLSFLLVLIKGLFQVKEDKKSDNILDLLKGIKDSIKTS